MNKSRYEITIGTSRMNLKTLSKTNIGVPVDTRLWRRLQELAIKDGKFSGELLDMAIKDYLDRHEG